MSERDDDWEWEADADVAPTPGGIPSGNPYARRGDAFEHWDEHDEEHADEDDDGDEHDEAYDDASEHWDQPDEEYADEEYADEDADAADVPGWDNADVFHAGPPSVGARPGRASSEPPARRTSNRGTRSLVLAVLLVLLAGGVALSSRDVDASRPRVAAVPDGPVVPPADAVSTAWYCAAGTATRDGGAEETVYVANVSAEPVTAEVRVLVGGDGPPAARMEVEPYGREGLRIADVVTADSPGVVVEVTGGSAIVEHELRGSGDVAMSPCAQEPSDSWHFAAGTTIRGAAQALELFNPFGDDAIVDITFLTESGVQEPQALQGFVIPRRSKVRVPVADHVARQERVATVVRARTGRIVAEQLQSFDGTDGRSGLALALGAPAARREWTLPVGEAVDGAVGAIDIANFAVTPTVVEVSILIGGEGVLEPETLDLPSRSVVRFDPGARVPAGTAYTAVVRAVGARPVVAESRLVTGAGAASSGGARPARRWALAGAPDGAASEIVATNRGSTPVTVELLAHTAGDRDGPTSAPAIAAGPGRTVRFDLDEWGIDPEQVLVVVADGPIVVGRETFLGAVSVAPGVPFRD